MKTIIINKEKLNTLIESKEEITFYSFFVHVKNFLKQLLEDPVNAESSNELKTYLNCDNKHVIEKLIDYDIIRRHNKIVETPKEITADGNSKVRYSVQYTIPKKNFKEKIHRLYEKETLNEQCSVFANEDEMKEEIYNSDLGEEYKTRGGINEFFF